jgi:hypothetical protein
MFLVETTKRLLPPQAQGTFNNLSMAAFGSNNRYQSLLLLLNHDGEEANGYGQATIRDIAG